MQCAESTSITHLHPSRYTTIPFHPPTSPIRPQVSIMSMRMDSRSPFDRLLELLPPPAPPPPYEVELAAKLLATERRATGSVTPNAARRSRQAPAAALEETREEQKKRLHKRLEQYRSAAPVRTDRVPFLSASLASPFARASGRRETS